MYVCVCYGRVCQSSLSLHRSHTRTHTHTHTDVAGTDTAALSSHAVALSVPSPASRRRLVTEALSPSHVSCAAPSAQSLVPPVGHSPHLAVHSIAQTGMEPPAQVQRVDNQDTDERGPGDDEDDEVEEGMGDGEVGEGSAAGVEHGDRQVQAADVTEGDTASVTEAKKVWCVCVFVCPLSVCVILQTLSQARVCQGRVPEN